MAVTPNSIFPYKYFIVGWKFKDGGMGQNWKA